jgi:hypothetical protein
VAALSPDACVIQRHIDAGELPIRVVHKCAHLSVHLIYSNINIILVSGALIVECAPHRQRATWVRVNDARGIPCSDTKISNVLFDTDSGGALCVVDLDTVMPGSVVFDFGDMARSICSTCPEDGVGLTRRGQYCLTAIIRDPTLSIL